jgi:hypothetical protein
MFRALFFVLLLLAGCGSADSPAAFTAPASIGGEWTLSEAREIAAEEVSDLVRGAGVLEAIRARYDGPAPLVITFCRMPASGNAFELVQRWRPAEGRLATYSGSWFVELEAPELDHGRLSALAEELDRSLAGD